MNLPRDINVLDHGAGTAESPVSLNDKDKADVISVLSDHPILCRNTMDESVAEEKDNEEEEDSSMVSTPVTMNGGVERTEGDGDEAAEEIISVHSSSSDMDIAVDDCFIGRK